MARIPYLEIGRMGQSRWFDYAFGAWFILAGWFLIATLFSLPMVDIAESLGIELLSAADTEEMAAAAESPKTQMGLIFVGLSVIGVPLTYFISRTTENLVSRMFGIIGIAFIVLSLVGLGLLIESMSTAASAEDPVFELLGRSPMAYGLMLFGFIGAWIAAWLVLKFIHFRPFRTVMTAASRVRWSRIIWPLLLVFGVYAAIAFIGTMSDGEAVYANPERSRMLPFLIVSLLFIPIQAGAEELIFRGYLNQALGRFIPSALIVFVLTSLLFAMLHLQNPEIGQSIEDGTFLFTFLTYALFGFVLCLMVWIDNGIESAIGVHVANNLWAAIFINYEGSVLPVPGLFVARAPDLADIWVSYAGLAIVLAVIWFTRKPLSHADNIVLPPLRNDPS